MTGFTAPTKTNLVKTKEDLAAAITAYDILDHKREILIIEMNALIKASAKRNALLVDALGLLARRFSRVKEKAGPSLSGYLTMPRILDFQAEIKMTRTMGVKMPQLSAIFAIKYKCGVEECGVAINEISNAMHDLRGEILYYAQSTLALRRIKKEIDKTQKRLRALENIHMVNCRETITRITGVLEENERGELNRYKKLKKKLRR